MTTTTTTPRIYVVSLSDYNAGELHGAWIDALDVDDMHEAVARMLSESGQPNAEEYAIHDYEGFGSVRIGENDSINLVAEMGAFIGEFEWMADARTAFLADIADNDPSDWESDFDDQYAGTWDSFRDYSDNFVEDVYGAEFAKLDVLGRYFDWESFARDLAHDYYVIPADDGGVHVFRSC